MEESFVPLFLEPGDRPGPPGVVVRADGSHGYLDRHGQCWRVQERECAAAPWARRDRCLVFQSTTGSGVLRRVWAVPPDWRTLDARSLDLLSERT